MVDEFPKFFDGGPVLKNEVGVGTLVERNNLGDVVNFCVVKMAGDNFTDSAWFVAVITSVLQVGSVFQLLFRGEIEKFFSDGELIINFLLCEAEVDYVEEASESLVMGID